MQEKYQSEREEKRIKVYSIYLSIYTYIDPHREKFHL